MSENVSDDGRYSFSYYEVERGIEHGQESYGTLHEQIKLVPVRGSDADKDPAYGKLLRGQILAARKRAEESIKELSKHKPKVEEELKRNLAILWKLNQGGGHLTHWQTKTEFDQAILTQRQRCERIRLLGDRLVGMIRGLQTLIKESHKVVK
jgi:hypothetical protein